MFNVTQEELQEYLRLSMRWDLVRADAAFQPHVTELLFNNKTNLTSELLVYRDVAWWLTIVWTPLMVGVGLLGNLLCMITLLRSPLKDVSPSHYLAARAGADAAFLLTVFLVWLADFKQTHEYFYQTIGWCQFVAYGSRLSNFLTTWTTVSLMVDRLIFIRFPEKRKNFCTPFKARAVILALLIIAMVVSLNISLMEGVLSFNDWYMCTPVPQLMSIMRVLAKMDMAVNFILPVLIFMIVTLSLQRKLCTTKASGVSPGENPQIIINMQMTKVSLVATLLYVVLAFPTYIMTFHHIIRGTLQEDALISSEILVAQHALFFLFFASRSINMFLYSCCNRYFRQCLCCRRKREKLRKASTEDVVVDID